MNEGSKKEAENPLKSRVSASFIYFGAERFFFYNKSDSLMTNSRKMLTGISSSKEYKFVAVLFSMTDIDKKTAGGSILKSKVGLWNYQRPMIRKYVKWKRSGKKEEAQVLGMGDARYAEEVCAEEDGTEEGEEVKEEAEKEQEDEKCE